MIASAAILSAALIGACDATTSTSADVLAAFGFALLADGEDERAALCLEAAERSQPGSPLIERDLAVAYARLGRQEEALAKIERAIAHGDADAEARLLRAMLLDAAGRRTEAIFSARALRSAEGDLLGAALHDPASVHRAAELAQEDTARAALAALVLAADAGERGLEGVARLLADTAEERASTAGAPNIQNAARDFERRLDEHGRVRTDLRLRASIDHATNPLYAERADNSALRAAFAGEFALQLPIDIARLDVAVRADQHAILTHRADYHELDLSMFGIAASLEVPISPRPSSVLLGLRARATDVFGDLFRVHFATALEGGPYLVLPLGSSLAAELGFYGVAVDFIDRSPPDRQISSQNRDRVGQRAVLALSFAAELLDGRVEASFLRDDALGDAFDVLGGIFSGRLRAYPGNGVVLGTAVSVTGRDYGPVGDRAIIGPAATRTEIRSAVELSARIPFSKAAAIVVEDVWIRNNARRGHRFTENVLSIGAEVAW